MDVSREDQSPSSHPAGTTAGPAVARYPLGGLPVFSARGELDLDTLRPLADALTEASETHSTVILDASGITFADSSFLNLLLRIHRRTELRIAAPQAQLLRLLEITGGDTVLDIRPTLDAATGV
jgi:anti-anti-sigma factor